MSSQLCIYDSNEKLETYEEPYIKLGKLETRISE